MAPIRRLADVIIDTTKFNVHELRQFIIERFQNPGRRPLLISVVSFGFRYGIPGDADLVFDVRFLPNPHFVPRLRPFSGKDPRVARYIRSFPQTGEFLRRIESLLGYLIPHYIREGKSYLTIALGLHGRAPPLCRAGRSDSRALCSAKGMRPRSCIAIWTNRLGPSGFVSRLRLARIAGAMHRLGKIVRRLADEAMLAAPFCKCGT